jgi:FKBP12-rapamycin complex-associated protein
LVQTNPDVNRAIIDIHNKDYAMAFKRIGKAQRLLYDELHRNSPKDSSLAMESLAKGQFLTELQEVMQYISSPETRHYILHAWRERFKRSSKNPNMWTKRLRIWSMACPNQTKELQHCWL